MKMAKLNLIRQNVSTRLKQVLAILQKNVEAPCLMYSKKCQACNLFLPAVFPFTSANSRPNMLRFIYFCSSFKIYHLIMSQRVKDQADFA